MLNELNFDEFGSAPNVESSREFLSEKNIE